MKAWLTSDTIHITHKGRDGFDAPNYSHWVMTANNPKYFPIEPGDTRVVMWEVTPFEGEEIPRETLLGLLRREAPHFLNRLFAIDVTDVSGRHTLPVLSTDEKVQALESAKNSSEFHGMSDTAKKAIAAIEKLHKPWEGTGSDLCNDLGDWDGLAKSRKLRTRASTLGRQMARIQPVLKDRGINLKITPGRYSHYAISA